MSWTYERVEKLKQLWEEGLTASRIAAELGEVTRNAVIGKAHRLGQVYGLCQLLHFWLLLQVQQQFYLR